MGKYIKIFFTLIIILGITAVLTSCDSFLSFKGIIYDWVNASPDMNSKIYVVPNVAAGVGQKSQEQVLQDVLSQISENISKMPLEGATIMFRDNRSGPNSQLFYKATSNISGEFDNTINLTGLGKRELLFEITKPGYQEASIRVQYDEKRTWGYTLVVFLVKERN